MDIDSKKKPLITRDTYLESPMSKLLKSKFFFLLPKALKIIFIILILFRGIAIII